MKLKKIRNCVSAFIWNMRDEPGQWLSRLVFLLGPWVALWMVEILNQNDVFKDLHLWQVAMNLLWYYILFVVCRLIFGRLRTGGGVAIVLSFVVGLVNHYILRFRGRILFPADIPGWRTAANVAEGFDYSIDHYIQQAAILLIAYLFLLYACNRQKKRAKFKPLVAAVLVLAVGGYSFAFFKTDMLPNLGIYTQQWVTQANGFLLNFTVALRYSSVDKPDGYTTQKVLDLMEQYPGTAGDDTITRPQNIVVIMNESFSDMTIFDTLDVDEDPTPFLHSMKENTIQGWMYSPVTGGGTASVEFEYLTGFSTIFQPPHTVAYQLYVEENMPSLGALAQTLGYETTAFHPYKSSGWNRPIAYRYLSFEHQLYEEDVEDGFYIRQYVSDQSDYDTVIDVTDKANQAGESSFIFNVTMQNHSGYAQGWKNLERSVDLSTELRTADANAQQYFSLIKASDDALEALLTYYSQVEEDTMVVFFGDHQAPLKNVFYEALYGKKLSERTTEEVMMQYAVPFFIWTNYDIEEQDNVIISPNYLGVLTAKTAGLPTTGYMDFLWDMYQELPAITPVGLVTGGGEYLKKAELNETQQTWMEQYELLNYCGMVGLFDEARPMFSLAAD